jgi:hypothetical protein
MIDIASTSLHETAGDFSMKRRPMTIGLALALLAGCSVSKTPPPGPGVDARPGAGGGAAAAAAPTGTGGGGGNGGGGGIAGGGGTGAELDAAVNGTADAGPDADAGRDGADLPPARDARALPDGPYRYPDPSGALCGDTRHTLAKTPAEVMLVLDRSGSMAELTIPPSTRWDDATAAVNGALAANPQLAWGIKLFPTGDTVCGLSPNVEVPAQFGTPAAIARVIDRAGPPKDKLGQGTPTDKVIKVVAGHLKAVTAPLPKYIILVTDGVPSCAANLADDPGTTITAIKDAAAAGIPTFVIGVGYDDQGLGTLDQMAVAGGKPRTGMPKFYPAANRAELDDALAAITLAITTCVFPLAIPPLDPEFVGVTVDGQLIPRDPAHAEGWDYLGGGMGVQIFGSACTDLKNGTAMSVGIHYGCPK